tara:strand:+ start:7538 stop:9850 length:2313 start_codon:yes stop_codon:yes gene_type:complete
MYKKYNFEINKKYNNHFYNEINAVQHSELSCNLRYLNIKDKMSYLENFIYETAKHYSYLHLNSDLTNKSIEFWLKTYETTEGHHNLHWDRDESIPFSTNEKYNELTIISFLENTDSIIPTIITNVQRKHNIDLSNPDLFTSPSIPYMMFVFPKKNTQIVFKGGKYLHGSYPFHSFSKAQKRDILIINIWNNHKFDYKNILYSPEKTFLHEDKENILFSFKEANTNTVYNEVSSNNIFLKELKNGKFDYQNKLKPKEKYFFYDSEKIINNNFKNDYFFYCPYYRPITSDTYNFLLITVATDENNKGFKILLKSINQHKINYKVLGLSDIWTGGNMEKGAGGGQKINLLKNELITWNYKDLQNTIVLFTDAYDVLICGNMQTILDSYFQAIKEYKQFDKVMFSGEKVCWPDESLINMYPHSNEYFRFLNSGSFIGTAYNILEIIENASIKNDQDDQLYYSKYFIFNPEKIFIDYHCILFQTFNQELDHLNLIFENNLIENPRFYTTPCVLHGNGESENKEMLYFLSEYLFKNIHKITYKKNYMSTLLPLKNIINNNIKTFIISLEKDVERRNKLKYKLLSSGLTDVAYFPAIDGDKDLHKYNFNVHSSSAVNTGEIGCFLSHYSVWNYVFQNNIEYALVLEDDATFRTCFSSYLNKITSNFKNLDFDILRLSAWKCNYDRNKYNNFLEYSKDWCVNAQSYIITFNGAKKIINSSCLQTDIVAPDDFFSLISQPNNIYKLHNFKILQTQYDLCSQEFREVMQSNLIGKPKYIS